MARHPKIDEEAYEAGKKAFSKGVSLRSLFEEAAKKEAATTDHIQGRAEEEKSISKFLGFADGVLDALRGKKK